MIQPTYTSQKNWTLK